MSTDVNQIIFMEYCTHVRTVYVVFPHALFMYTVHGFASVSYTVVEREQLTTTFGPNVKGNSLLGANIGGQIIAEEGTARMFIITEINGAVCIKSCTFSTVFQQPQYQLLP